MSGEPSTSKIRNRLVPSWVKRATSSSSKGTSNKTASTSATDDVQIIVHPLPPPWDLPRISSLAETPACQNLISVLGEPLKTARDTGKEGASHINHHDCPASVLLFSAVCPLCTLIVHAVLYGLEWCLEAIVREIFLERSFSIRELIQTRLKLFKNGGSTWKTRIPSSFLKPRLTSIPIGLSNT